MSAIYEACFLVNYKRNKLPKVRETTKQNMKAYSDQKLTMQRLSVNCTNIVHTIGCKYLDPTCEYLDPIVIAHAGILHY